MDFIAKGMRDRGLWEEMTYEMEKDKCKFF